MKTRTSRSSARKTRTFLLVSALALGATFAACSASQGPSSSSGDSSNSVSSSGIGGEGGMAGAGGMATGGAAGGNAGNGSAVGCQTDADCVADAGNTATPVCNIQTGHCVECLPQASPKLDCGVGSYCNPTELICEAGCTGKDDCTGGTICDEVKHECVMCIGDQNCADGQVCLSGTCVPGCSGTKPCGIGFTCCNGLCYDLIHDELNCGLCRNVCAPPINGKPVCDNGFCVLGACNPGFADCNQNPQDGCEWNVLQEGPCSCTPKETRLCYQGSPGTNNIGACKSGTQTCNDEGTAWSLCTGQVLPRHEVCGNNADDDCNGVVDDNSDLDQDGWSSCGGDCCDSVGPGCDVPKDINPGAFEVLNDGTDNDCSATTADTVPDVCSPSAKFTGVTALDMVRAMDLCRFTTENPPLLEKRWGVISAELLLSDGNKPNASQLTVIQDKQTAIMTAFGVNVEPLRGATFAGMSTGVMRDQDDPGYQGISNNMGTTSQPPTSYLLANGNALPNSQGCSGTCEAGSGARDPVNLRVKIRTPTNAKSFTYKFRFYSSEYWTWQCTKFNDFFLGLYKSTWTPTNPMEKPLPGDKNVAIDCPIPPATGPCNPISVNNGFFNVCAPKGCNSCGGGIADLAGTGMQVANEGGATAWLYNDVPNVPAEIIQLDLIIFDVGDAGNNSLVLLDDWTWNTIVRQGVHD